MICSVRFQEETPLTNQTHGVVPSADFARYQPPGEHRSGPTGGVRHRLTLPLFHRAQTAAAESPIGRLILSGDNVPGWLRNRAALPANFGGAPAPARRASAREFDACRRLPGDTNAVEPA